MNRASDRVSCLQGIPPPSMLTTNLVVCRVRKSATQTPEFMTVNVGVHGALMISWCAFS